MVLTYFPLLAVPVIIHAVYTFMLICGCFAVLQRMPSCTQRARFLSLALLESMIISAALVASFRHQVVSHAAYQPSHFQFSMEQLLPRLRADFNNHVYFSPFCPELESGCDLPRFHAQFWILG